MFEKVNMYHPDKIADRIAGALVDMAYSIEKNPRIAVEVLIGHGVCNIIAETSVKLDVKEVEKAVVRISGEPNIKVLYKEVPQDKHLAENQKEEFHCGDNGIFKGVPTSDEEERLSYAVKQIQKKYPYDGKFIFDLKDSTLIACQSHLWLDERISFKQFVFEIRSLSSPLFNIVLNPLGEWTGGINVDTGATNRKLGSDMGRAVTGGGLHGKDLSKADVTLNIYAHLQAQKYGKEVEIKCAIGDKYIDGLPYAAIVEIARDYIHCIGGFEKFAEWGLI